jgi:uncharacterized protein YbjT (DUF2867 family)
MAGRLDSSEKIFITGATGIVGSEVANALQRMGVNFRAGVADASRVTGRWGERVTAVPFRFGEAETYPGAFKGIEAVFLMRPPKISNVKKYLFPAIDAAIAAGVKRFSFLSLIGIEKNPSAPHFSVEQYLQMQEVDYTFLRCSFFMQNLSTTHRDEIRLRNELYIPAGNSKTSFIDAGDIGAAAALTLTQAGHAKKAYELTGTDALDYYQVAEIFTQVLGRKITYRNPSSIAFVLRQMRDGRELPFALVMAYLYSHTTSGMAAGVTAEIERLTGRKPVTLRQFVENYRQSWQ